MNSSDYNYEFSLETITPSDLMMLFVCSPICIVGFFLSLFSSYILSRAEFKSEKLFAYIKLECILMTIDFAVVAFRSLSLLYMCISPICPLTNSLFLNILKNYVCIFLPSPLEATVLFADVFASLSCLTMLKQNKNKFEQLIFDIEPHLIVTIGFLLFFLMFLFQPLALLHQIDFFLRFDAQFEITAFVVRDGILLGILIILNVVMVRFVRSNLKRKLSIAADKSVKERTKKSQRRMTIMVLADCINSTIGRIPVLLFFVIRNIDVNIEADVPYFVGICFIAVYLAYLFKFFIFYHFNKRFKIMVIKSIPSRLRQFVTSSQLYDTNNSTL